MNRTEVTKLLKRIKAHWSYFNDAEYVIDEWLKYLKPYENYDVNLKLDGYFEDGDDKPPTPKYMARYLKTPEEKAKTSNDYIVCCNLCGREMSLSTYNSKHYSRCLSIRYIIKQLKKYDKEVSYEELQELSDEVFERVYLKYSDLDMQKLKKKVGVVSEVS